MRQGGGGRTGCMGEEGRGTGCVGGEGRGTGCQYPGKGTCTDLDVGRTNRTRPTRL